MKRRAAALTNSETVGEERDIILRELAQFRTRATSKRGKAMKEHPLSLHSSHDLPKRKKAATGRASTTEDIFGEDINVARSQISTLAESQSSTNANTNKPLVASSKLAPAT